MPGFDEMYADTFEVDEDTMFDDNLVVEEDYADDVLIVEDHADDFLAEEDQEDDLEVTEDDDSLMVEEDYIYDTVPGSETRFEEYNAEDDEADKNEKSWDEDGDPGKFMDWIKLRLTQIPRHSGQTVPGCERAISYLKDLEGKSSKAMRSDYNGKIDEMELDEIRRNMQSMIDRLENHIERLKKKASVSSVRFTYEDHCDKCESQAPMWYDAVSKTASCMNCDHQRDDIQKTAGTPVLSVYMTPFERSVVSTMINAKVAGGRNIEDVYEHLKNKYNFTPREELSFQQLLADHGYPVFKDRGLLNEAVDPASGDSIEWQTNYYA